MTRTFIRCAVVADLMMRWFACFLAMTDLVVASEFLHYRPSPPPSAEELDTRRLMLAQEPERLDENEGANRAYAFRRDSENSGVMIITPRENPGDAFYISESFFRSTHGQRALTPADALTVLASYPQIAEDTYANHLALYYPDENTRYGAEFAARQAQLGHEGTLSLVQDELAEPYVRVQLQNGVDVETFSINRETVARLLANPFLTENQLADALRTFPFRLPEMARYHFSSMNQEQIVHLAERQPEIQQLENGRLLRLNRAKGVQPVALAGKYARVPDRPEAPAIPVTTNRVEMTSRVVTQYLTIIKTNEVIITVQTPSAKPPPRSRFTPMVSGVFALIVTGCAGWIIIRRQRG